MKLHRSFLNIGRLIFEGNFSFNFFIWSPKTVLCDATVTTRLYVMTALDWTEQQMDLLVTEPTLRLLIFYCSNQILLEIF